MSKTTLGDLIDSGKISRDDILIGELVKTADGAIVGRGAELFDPGGGGPNPDGTTKMYVQDHSSMPEAHWYFGSWYSTRAAAEAARSKQ